MILFSLHPRPDFRGEGSIRIRGSYDQCIDQGLLQGGGHPRVLFSNTGGVRLGRRLVDRGGISAGAGMSYSRLLLIISSHHYRFQGLVNLEAEVAKCDKKIDLARLNLEKLYKVISQPDYQATVPEAVQLGNEEKVGIRVAFCVEFGADCGCL